MKRSCEDMGLCQSRTPRCMACSLVEHPFAPGVIDGAPARKPALLLGFRATDLAGAMALVALAFFVAGWLL
jgi:hypothetical protein